MGEERVGELIRRLQAEPAAEMIDAFYRAVLDLTAGTRQGDHLTAVIVKRTPAVAGRPVRIGPDATLRSPRT